MSICLQHIYLFSEQPEKLYHFLSFIFDIEASEYTAERILLPFENFHFAIQKPHKKRMNKSLPFSLSVETESGLLDLKSNVEFFYYKEGQSKYNCSISKEVLTFSDPDNREWRVNISETTQPAIQKLEKPTEHVRNC